MKEKEKILVMKFGGTSVGTTEAMRQAAEIVRQTRISWERVVVVTSALSGVTDRLLQSARRAAEGEAAFAAESAQRLRQRHKEMAENLLSPEARLHLYAECAPLWDEFSLLCQAIGVLGEASPRALDAVASLGERLSVRLLAAVIRARGIPAEWVSASQLIRTDAHFGAAHPDLESSARQSRARLLPLLARGQVPVVTGFLGATAEGVITTLGRGGSDYSAAILGAALPAEEVWIWTDVDGVLTADPRLEKRARSIPQLTYREMAELAYFGAKVLHPKTVLPLIERGIGLRIANTFAPHHAGTRLHKEKTGNGKARIKAVTSIPHQCLVTVEGRGMIGVPGVAARTFSAVASTGTSVRLISQASSEQSICFAIPQTHRPEVLEALEKAFAHELNVRDIDRIWASEEIAIITVVGEGMKHTPGISGRVFSALGEHEINVMAIAQGSSEVSISLIVTAETMQAAVNVLHDLILQQDQTS